MLAEMGVAVREDSSLVGVFSPKKVIEMSMNHWWVSLHYEWKRLLAEIKNIKLNTNNNIKQYIH